MNNSVSKAKTRKQLADEYGICVKTLNRRFEKAKIDPGPGLIFPKQLKTIYDTFGIPESSKKS